MRIDNPLVSVIIPLYNVEKYVEEAIRSIMNQTYKNIEIIVVDDASVDNTYRIARNLAKEDERIKLFQNKVNSQIVTTLNLAYHNSIGDYILRMDGDDISPLDRIDVMLEFLIKNIQYDLIGTSMIAIDESGNKIGETIHYKNEDLLKDTLKYIIPMSHIWMSKRKVYEELNGYREISGAEDDDFIFRATSHGYKYTNLEDYFGYYVRLGRVGNSNSLLGLKKLKMRNYTYKLFLEQVKNNGQDSFSQHNLNEYIKSNKIIEKLHSYSNNFIYKAIENKGKKQYIRTIIFLLLSCISLYQIKYLFDRFMYKIIVKEKKRRGTAK